MKLRRCLESDSGAIAIFVAVLIVVLLALAAVVIDAGLMYTVRRDMQTAADAGAMAGVQDLPSDPVVADASANTYALANRSDISVREVDIYATNAPNDTIRVHVQNPDVSMTLARLMGFSTEPVGATAIAQVQSPSRMNRVFPFGLMSEDATAAANAQSFDFYEFGDEIPLKVSIDTKLFGNFHTLNLGPQPQNLIKEINSGGEGVAVEIGQHIKTSPGNRIPVVNEMNKYVASACGDTPQHTWDDDIAPANPGELMSLPDDPDGIMCGRVIAVPLIVNNSFPTNDPRHWNWVEVKGASNDIVIEAFAYIWVDSIFNPKDKDEPWVIYGRFLDTVDPDALDYGAANQYGIIAFKLID